MRISATISDSYDTATKHFATEAEFEAEKQRLYDQINRDQQGNKLPIGWYARQELRDPYPERFPCLMIYKTSATDGDDGPSIIENFFLYDVSIEDEEDKD